MRGYSLMAGYFGDPAATAAAIDGVGSAYSASIAPVGRAHSPAAEDLQRETPRRQPSRIPAGQADARNFYMAGAALPPSQKAGVPLHSPKQQLPPAVQDRWMHTGDLAVMDSQGYCSIVGRIKDMVIRGGENVYRERRP